MFDHTHLFVSHTYAVRYTHTEMHRHILYLHAYNTFTHINHKRLWHNLMFKLCYSLQTFNTIFQLYHNMFYSNGAVRHPMGTTCLWQFLTLLQCCTSLKHVCLETFWLLSAICFFGVMSAQCANVQTKYKVLFQFRLQPAVYVKLYSISTGSSFSTAWLFFLFPFPLLKVATTH